MLVQHEIVNLEILKQQQKIIRIIFLTNRIELRYENSHLNTSPAQCGQ